MAEYQRGQVVYLAIEGGECARAVVVDVSPLGWGVWCRLPVARVVLCYPASCIHADRADALNHVADVQAAQTEMRAREYHVYLYPPYYGGI